ncbi:aspartate/glutamate racemase family protein [Thermodesulfobacteriota bacterium]
MKIMVIHVAPKQFCSMKQGMEELEKFIQKNYASPGTQIISSFPEEIAGAGAIHRKQMDARAVCGLSHHLLAPALVKKALEAQESGFDAVVQVNTYDPGIEASRFVLKIPVLGVGQASCHLASILADRIGIIVPFDTSIPNARRRLKAYGVSDFVASIVPANPRTDKNPTPEEVLQNFEDAGRKCLESGAQIIVPLCGVFIPLTISAKALSERIGAQVVDNLAVGIGLAEMLVRLGLTHSEIGYPSLVKIMSSDIS